MTLGGGDPAHDFPWSAPLRHVGARIATGYRVSARYCATAAARKISRHVPDLEHLNLVAPYPVRAEVVAVHDQFPGVLVGPGSAQQRKLAQAADLVGNGRYELRRYRRLVLRHAGRDTVQVGQRSPRPADLHLAQCCTLSGTSRMHHCTSAAARHGFGLNPR